MLKSWLGKKGFDAYTASNVARAKKAIEASLPDLILSDLRLPDEDGTQLLAWSKEQGYSIPFIIMTSYAEIQSAVQAMKLGACDYIAKPVNPDELLKKFDEALTIPSKEKETVLTKPAVKSKQALSTYLEGKSEVAQQLYSYVSLVAPTNMSVLINGASGTGKEHIAKRIHDLSPRSNKPFIAIDCGAMPKELAA